MRDSASLGEPRYRLRHLVNAIKPSYGMNREKLWMVPELQASAAYSRVESRSVHSMIQLIYISAEVEPFTRNRLRDLLDVSRRNNEAAGVTGMLVYHDGTFLQVLEGEKETVEKLLETIDADPRHHKIKLLLRQEIEERSFGGWSMGFVNASGASLDAYPGFVDFFGAGPPFDESHGDRAKQALERFRSGQWRL